MSAARDVVLRVLEPADAVAMLDLQVRNRSYWQAAGPPRDESWFTLDAQRRRLAEEAEARAGGRGLSRRVLEKVGFRREGLALRYLRLHDGWTDQELWAITIEDARPRWFPAPGRART